MQEGLGAGFQPGCSRRVRLVRAIRGVGRSVGLGAGATARVSGRAGKRRNPGHTGTFCDPGQGWPQWPSRQPKRRRGSVAALKAPRPGWTLSPEVAESSSPARAETSRCSSPGSGGSARAATARAMPEATRFVTSVRRCLVDMRSARGDPTRGDAAVLVRPCMCLSSCRRCQRAGVTGLYLRQETVRRIRP